MTEEKKSIFDFADKFGYESPFDYDWVTDDFKGADSQKEKDEKQKVQYYTHPDKKQFENQRDKTQTQYKNTKSKFIEYYKKIGKITDKSTEKEIWDVFSDANKKELERLEELKNKNQKLFDEATSIEKQWNKLDVHLENVVDDFNKRKGFSGAKRLDPSLLKALLFSESEMGASVEYKKLVESVPKSNPNAVYQLNIGRVTDGNVYNAVVREFKIPVNWKTNYLDFGNKNDVMLAAGALIQKRDYALKTKSSHFKTNSVWFNAIVAYKGVSAEGASKAELVWKLFEKGIHPYTPSKKLF
jgi:hypothetical protein